MKHGRNLGLTAVMLCFVSTLVWAQGQQSQEEQMKAYVEMMRKDLRAEKHTVVDRAMGLEPGDKAKFWGVYEKYEGEVKALWDQRLANIKKYSDNYDRMTEAVADELAIKALDLESQRSMLHKKYYVEMKTALGARAAARFLQVEAMLEHIIDIQIGSEIPLVH